MLNYIYSTSDIVCCIITENGRYFYLLETNRLPSYNASLKISFMDTSNKCLMFFYKIFGENAASLNVFTVDVSPVDSRQFC